METGHPVTATAAVVRNLFRLIDCYLPVLPFLPGLAMIFLHRRNQRLGDVVAGTIVVRDRPTEWSLGAVPAAPDEPLEHTSELQSLAYLVCRLLLEKKKKKSSLL